MFGWIPATFGLVMRNFGAMSIASLINLLVIVLMMVPMIFLMFKALSGGAAALSDPGSLFGEGPGLILAIYGLVIVFSLLLMPPLMAGWFRLCENADRGAAASGTDILRPYADIPLWLRLLGFVALGVALYALVFALIGFAFRGAFEGLIQMQAAQNAALLGGPPAPPPSMDMLGAVFLMYAVMLPLMFLLQFVYMVGLAEVSLRSTPVLVAFKDACTAVARNSLKLLLFMLALMVVGGVLAFIVGLVLALLIAATAFISQTASLVLLVALYIPILLVIYPLMFAGNYVVWKSMLGEEPSMPPASAGAVAA